MRTVVQLDDRPEEKVNARLQERAQDYDVELLAASTVAEASELVREAGPSGLVVDLKLSHGENSVHFIRRSLIDRPWLPAVFYSGFLGDQLYRNRRYEISPYCLNSSVKKDDDTAAPVLERVSMLAEKASRNVKVLDDAASVVRDQLQSVGDLFSIGRDEYLALPRTDRRARARDAYECTSPFLDVVFRRTRAAWIVTAGHPLNIVLWGESLQELPRGREKMDEIAFSNGGCNPQLFVAPVEVEETEVDGWTSCDGDWYPSLEVSLFTADNEPRTNRFHFDTGSQNSWLSAELLDQNDVPWDDSAPLVVKVKRTGAIADAYSSNVSLSSDPERPDLSRSISALVVEDWVNSSPVRRECEDGACPGSERLAGSEKFFCGQRHGFLGRNFLVEDAGITVTLDGSERRSHF